MSLAGLSKHETARTGLVYGMAGMAIAISATIWLTLSGEWNDSTSTGFVLLVAALLVGALIGLWRARVVAMTGMPELIALFHSFVGLTAVLVGWNGALHTADVTVHKPAILDASRSLISKPRWACHGTLLYCATAANPR